MSVGIRISVLAIAVAACALMPKGAVAQGQPLIRMGNCPAGYHPVCAVKKRTLVTYVNACAARSVGARVIASRACMEGCPRQYVPVCATNAAGARHTYGNACEAERSGANIVRKRGCQGLLGRR
jgi:Kazal-type serine protease inhibitor domain